LAVLRRGTVWRPIVVVLVAIAVVFAVSRITASPTPAPSPSPGIASAMEACHLPSSDTKAGGSLSWHLAVRLDAPTQSDLLFVSGWARLTCTTSRGADGSYGGSTTTAMGGSPSQPFVGDSLTYETGGGPSQGGQYPTQLVVGRTPSATAYIEIVTSDGERHNAALGGGWYMAYATANGGTRVTEIVAYDPSGKMLARLADPNGVQPGATASAS
jgi:hypothetical protein